MTIGALAAGICATSAGMHGLSVALAARRCRRRSGPSMPPPKDAKSVTIVQPLCGVETFSRETLRSIFALDYPSYEIIFCLASGDDPIAPLVRGAIAANPHRPARLLIGDDRISANPKLNNVVKGWKAARYDWVIVCAPPIGSRPESFAAEIECAFLNTYQARWQYAGESCGYGFAQGKTMLWRREILEAGGSIEALAAEIAEDAAATKLIRRQGFNAHLVDRPFQQPLGKRRLRDVWSRQLRWARLRRATFPFFFAPEIFTTSLLTFIAAAVAAPEFGIDPIVGAVLAAAFCYSAEAILALVAGWPLSWRSPAAWLARDVLLPFLWARGWSGRNVMWRGNAMDVDEGVFLQAESEPRPQI
jgi:ceramide glucosyltransferase